MKLLRPEIEKYFYWPRVAIAVMWCQMFWGLFLGIFANELSLRTAALPIIACLASGSVILATGICFATVWNWNYAFLPPEPNSLAAPVRLPIRGPTAYLVSGALATLLTVGVAIASISVHGASPMRVLALTVVLLLAAANVVLMVWFRAAWKDIGALLASMSDRRA